MLAPVALEACGGPLDFMSATGGPAARGLAQLGWIALLLFCAATVVVWLLLAWIAMRRRGDFASHAPVDEAAGGQSWILIGGFAIPAAILALLFVLMLSSLKTFPMHHAGDREPDIRVIGRQWWFDAEYRFARDDLGFHASGELHIPTGTAVDITLQTRDVIHSFWVPKLHGKVDLVPGLVNHLRISADRPGIYDGQCSEFCGVQHAHMKLRVVAESPDAYRQWVAAQRLPAHVPVSADARQGEAVFMAAPCAACHTVRGTDARGQVGPDLTHFASRSRFAGASLPNDTAELAAWITHAQSLKPGAQMPDMNMFSGEQLRQLTAYLQSLR